MNAPVGEGKNREIACNRMEDCKKRDAVWLELNDLGLSSLPGSWPPSVKYLNLSNNCLTCLPTLPDLLEFLYADHNLLTHLPEVWPAGVIELHLNFNQLEQLPKILPTNLTYLDVSDNRLKSLSDSLPFFIEVIIAYNNYLTHLSVSPIYLTEINVSNNQIKDLPEYFSPSLRTCDVSYNQITRIPAGIIAFAGAARFYVRHNPFPENVQRAIHDLDFNPSYYRVKFIGV